MPALLVMAAGCAPIPPSVSKLPATGGAIELDDTPFYPQERYQCGPAALTTVLVDSGATVSLDEIVDKVYLPGRQGSLQFELLAATRTEGRLPYRVDGTLDATRASFLSLLNAVGTEHEVPVRLKGRRTHITRNEVRMNPDQAEIFYDRLLALLNEFEQQEDNTNGETYIFNLTTMFLPIKHDMTTLDNQE